MASTGISSQTGPTGRGIRKTGANSESERMSCATTDARPTPVAEITARQKGYYKRKAFVTLSNMPVTVARCSK
jgi:hypothetical protein